MSALVRNVQHFTVLTVVPPLVKDTLNKHLYKGHFPMHQPI